MVQGLNIFWDSNPTESGEHTFHTHLHESNHADQDWKSLRPYFGWQSEQVIQDTYKVTSRSGGTIPHHDYLKNISNQEILFSISPEGMGLLPLTEACHSAHFWWSHGRCAMPGIPMEQLVGLSW